MKFATEIHVYILSLLLLSSTGQMECTAVPAQNSVFPVLCSPSPVPHCAAVTTSKLPPGPPPFPLNGEQLEQWVALPNNLTPKQLGYVKLLVVTYEEARKLEVETQQQAECPKWYELRFPRLTASSFGNICSKWPNQGQNQSWWQGICYNQNHQARSQIGCLHGGGKMKI